MGFFSWLFRRNKPKKIKIGLALGSGGAKGFAHLGALKAFEENGIQFDIIAGTSIGSLIGAFVAEGYSSTDIFELVKHIDLGEVKNLFMINMDTSGMFKVIDREIGSLNFEEMKKPFRAIATAVETGKEKVFDSGNVARAICASCCMPPFFKPVIIDGVRYIDGAYTNSVPADVVRKLGADYVIGVDLSSHEPKSSLLSKIFPTYKSDVKEPWAKGYQASDVMLHPDLREYTSLSINASGQMYEIGYNTAMKMLPQILQDISNLTYKRKKR